MRKSTRIILRSGLGAAALATVLGALVLLPTWSSRVEAQAAQGTERATTGAGPAAQMEIPNYLNTTPKGPGFRTEYVRVDASDDALLYTPKTLTARAKIAFVFSHPSGDNFVHPIGAQMASRGYRVLLVNQRGGGTSNEYPLAGMSNSIKYLKKVGAQKVIHAGWSGGGVAATFYTNIAQNGAKGCQKPQIIYPCKGTGLDNLAVPDGLLLLDSNLGAPYKIQGVDPAVPDDGSTTRDPSLDIFSAANGFDAANRKATYSAEFAKRFYAAQKARNDKLTAYALSRLKALESGASPYTDDEPLVVRGARSSRAAATLHAADPTHYLSRTRNPHTLLKMDGTETQAIIDTVRPAISYANGLKALGQWTMNTTVREYLSSMATRTTPDYQITSNDILGVDWNSNMMSTAGNAEGITVPALVVVMTCNDHIVHGEIIFDHLKSRDKTLAGLEGANHGFVPCKPEYGDTETRLYNFIDRWVQKPGRF